MNVFISWSGQKAKRVAIGLKAFLQDVNQRTDAWFSDTDISAGERWALELASRLDTTDFGIVCVTQQAMQSPWVLFESGALSKSVRGGRVCPYLVDVRREQLTGPLAQFQAIEATKDDTWRLLETINRLDTVSALPTDRLRKYFDNYWAALETELSVVNRDFKPLPHALREHAMGLLPKMLWNPSAIESLALKSGISVWKVDWRRAAIYVWQETIDVALDEHLFVRLISKLVDDYPMNEAIVALAAAVRSWASDGT